jgi:hypothetical protein
MNCPSDTGAAEQEWMPSTVELMFMANPKTAHYAIAKAHNAAIAKAIMFGGQLEEQLAAEREKTVIVAKRNYELNEQLAETLASLAVATEALRQHGITLHTPSKQT